MVYLSRSLIIPTCNPTTSYEQQKPTLVYTLTSQMKSDYYTKKYLKATHQEVYNFQPEQNNDQRSFIY